MGSALSWLGLDKPINTITDSIASSAYNITEGVSRAANNTVVGGYNVVDDVVNNIGAVAMDTEARTIDWLGQIVDAAQLAFHEVLELIVYATLYLVVILVGTLLVFHREIFMLAEGLLRLLIAVLGKFGIPWSPISSASMPDDSMMVTVPARPVKKRESVKALRKKVALAKKIREDRLKAGMTVDNVDQLLAEYEDRLLNEEIATGNYKPLEDTPVSPGLPLTPKAIPHIPMQAQQPPEDTEETRSVITHPDYFPLSPREKEEEPVKVIEATESMEPPIEYDDYFKEPQEPQETNETAQEPQEPPQETDKTDKTDKTDETDEPPQDDIYEPFDPYEDYEPPKKINRPWTVSLETEPPLMTRHYDAYQEFEEDDADTLHNAIERLELPSGTKTAAIKVWYGDEPAPYRVIRQKNGEYRLKGIDMVDRRMPYIDSKISSNGEEILKV